MAQRKGEPAATSGRDVRPLPPEADGDFDVVPEAEIAEWREKLDRRFGVGAGRLRVIDDPATAG